MLSLLVLSTLIGFTFADDWYVTVKNNGPVVIGANVTFTAELFNSGSKASGHFKYKWYDNLYPQNTAEFEGGAESQWTVHYPVEYYRPGTHEVDVYVYQPTVLIDWPLCYRRSSFQLSDMLVGQLVSSQNTSILNPAYVSSAAEVTHEVRLNPPDAEYLKKNASSVVTYWFVDCLPVGNSTDLKYHHKYSVADLTYHITALVVASHLPPTNSSIHNVTASTPNTSTEVDLISSTSTPSELKSLNSTSPADNTKLSYLTINNATVTDPTISPPSFSCSSKNITSKLSNFSYGVFSSTIKVKAPIQKVDVKGSGWLQHGDMLNLQIYCNGSAPFQFCVKYSEGEYNVTGHENCTYFIERSAICSFQVTHYFSNSTHYTVLLIIYNDINKEIRAFGVDIYEVTKHAQLSVVIVPVSASIIAVVLVIFGVAYYIQNRNRFIVEVADFDISNTNDMEYKTFRERLIEAVHNAFYKAEDFSEQESYNEAPTNKKYGSMQ